MYFEWRSNKICWRVSYEVRESKTSQGCRNMSWTEPGKMVEGTCWSPGSSAQGWKSSFYVPVTCPSDEVAWRVCLSSCEVFQFPKYCCTFQKIFDHNCTGSQLLSRCLTVVRTPYTSWCGDLTHPGLSCCLSAVLGRWPVLNKSLLLWMQ